MTIHFMKTLLLPITPQEMIERNATKIRQIRETMSMGNDRFDDYVLIVINSLARYVQRLPLTPHVYGGEFGAWDFALNCAFTSFELARSKVFFQKAGPAERKRLHPQCHYMAFLSALCTAKAIQSQYIRVVDSETGALYNPLSSPYPLDKWLTKHTASISCMPNSPHLSGHEAAIMAFRIIPAGLLSAFDQRVVAQFYGSIYPSETPTQVLSSMALLVRDAVKTHLAHQSKIEEKIYVTPEEKALRVIPVYSGNQDQEPEGAEVVEEPVAPVRPSIDLENIPRDIQEFFTVFRQSPRYEESKKSLIITEKHIEFPVMFFGFVGSRASILRKKMEDLKYILSKSPDGKVCYIDLALKDLLIDKENGSAS